MWSTLRNKRCVDVSFQIKAALRRPHTDILVDLFTTNKDIFSPQNKDIIRIMN